MDLPDMSPEMLAHQLRVIDILSRRYGPERLLDVDTYTYTLNRGGLLTWDVTRAKAWVAGQAQPELLEVPRDQLEHIVRTFDIDEPFVGQADPTQPGIAAPIIDHDQIPPTIVYILIDGVHRATKAYRTGQPFFAVILPDDVSRDCVLLAPAEVIP